MPRNETAWTDNPQNFATTNRFKLLRCPSVRLKPYVILSDAISVARVHWAHRRSIPCSGEDVCELCKKQHPTAKGYLCVYSPDSGERYCLEVTPPTFEQIGAYRTLYGTLRGATIALSRAGTKENGRMSATLTPSGIPTTQLPESIDVQATMDALWDMPDKSARHELTTPRDEMGGQAAVDATIKRLQAAGLVDKDGNPILPNTNEETPQPTTKTTEKTNGHLPEDARAKFLERVNRKHKHKQTELLKCETPSSSPPSSN